jgi:hypothetical protein
MATENIVLLACATVLCTLHVVGGPLSGLFRSTPRRRYSRPPPSIGHAEATVVPRAENEVISRAS